MCEIRIDMEKIYASMRAQLSGYRTNLMAMNVLLSMDISKDARRDYILERKETMLRIQKLELELQEICNPSQLSLF